MLLDVSWDDFMGNKKLERIAKIPNLIDFIRKTNNTFLSKCKVSSNKVI